jgi:hypothetical protein
LSLFDRWDHSVIVKIHKDLIFMLKWDFYLIIMLENVSFFCPLEVKLNRAFKHWLFKFIKNFFLIILTGLCKDMIYNILSIRFIQLIFKSILKHWWSLGFR